MVLALKIKQAPQSVLLFAIPHSALPALHWKQRENSLRVVLCFCDGNLSALVICKRPSAHTCIIGMWWWGKIMHDLIACLPMASFFNSFYNLWYICLYFLLRTSCLPADPVQPVGESPHEHRGIPGLGRRPPGGQRCSQIRHWWVKCWITPELTGALHDTQSLLVFYTIHRSYWCFTQYTELTGALHNSQSLLVLYSLHNTQSLLVLYTMHKAYWGFTQHTELTGALHSTQSLLVLFTIHRAYWCFTQYTELTGALHSTQSLLVLFTIHRAYWCFTQYTELTGALHSTQSLLVLYTVHRAYWCFSQYTELTGALHNTQSLLVLFTIHRAYWCFTQYTELTGALHTVTSKWPVEQAE